MMKKINETMNHMTVTAYVKGNQMKNKVADTVSYTHLTLPTICSV